MLRSQSYVDSAQLYEVESASPAFDGDASQQLPQSDSAKSPRNHEVPQFGAATQPTNTRNSPHRQTPHLHNDHESHAETAWSTARETPQVRRAFSS